MDFYLTCIHSFANFVIRMQEFLNLFTKTGKMKKLININAECNSGFKVMNGTCVNDNLA